MKYNTEEKKLVMPEYGTQYTEYGGLLHYHSGQGRT